MRIPSRVSSLSTVEREKRRINLGVIGTIFLIIFAIASVLIIALVMLQDEQGEGFGGLFGGGGGATPFGATTGNVLTKATTILGILFMVSSLAVALAYKSGESDNVIGESRRAAAGGQDWFLEQPVDEVE